MSKDFNHLYQELKNQVNKLTGEIERLQTTKSELEKQLQTELSEVETEIKKEYRGYKAPTNSFDFNIDTQAYNQNLEDLVQKILNTRLGI